VLSFISYLCTLGMNFIVFMLELALGIQAALT